MKITRKIVLLVSLLLLLIVSTGERPVKADDQVPSTVIQKKTLYVGYYSHHIKLCNISEKANVTYSSSDEGVAEVSAKGWIKPISKGTAEIKVTIEQDGNSYDSSIMVTVKEPYVKFVKKIDQLVLETKDGGHETEPFVFTAKAVGVKNPQLEYTVEPDIAFIDGGTGELIGTRLGEVKVTVTEQSTKKTAFCRVNITEWEDKEVVLKIKGDYAYYEKYPQTKVKDAAIIKAIKKLDWDHNQTILFNGTEYLRIDNHSNRELKKGEYEYYIYEPIKWRIIDKTDKKVVLLSEYNLESHRYSKTGSINSDWENSELRAWLNGLDEFKERMLSFQKIAFSKAEYNALLSVSKDGVKSKIYILNKADVMNKNYGFSTSASKHVSRVCEPTDYALALGAYHLEGTASWWWLRTKGTGADAITDGGMAFVYSGGKICTSGMNGDNGAFGVRPVIQVDLSKCTDVRKN